MDLNAVIEAFSTDDGSLPDINLDFGEAPIAGDAYAMIQSRATHLVSTDAYYWSKSRQEECPIKYGDNPAIEYLRGEADSFHVVFGGLRSSAESPIPDLGVFVLGPGYVALDYRMGAEWNEAAIIGLFELLRDLSCLAREVQIANVNFLYDPDGKIMSSAFNGWLAANHSLQGQRP